MRKNYIKPQVEVFNIQVPRMPILQGSLGTNEKKGFVEGQFAREDFGWDDDERGLGGGWGKVW